MINRYKNIQNVKHVSTICAPELVPMAAVLHVLRLANTQSYTYEC